ncbi:MAG: MATE family efflux transporter [Methanothrix sp.]|jgi:putative MATE family efflux protein|nr:MATE family efflux transporter [Methanothrix sp.]
MSEGLPDRGERGQKSMTRGVSLLIGEPKKAILKLSWPMIMAMLILAAYNLVNAIWVAGLGSDALAAVGFTSPIFMVVVGLSNGLGAGVSSSISRRIGAQDKRGADNTTMHALLLVLAVSMILTAGLFIALEPLLIAMGAGAALGLAVDYGSIIFTGSIFIVFNNIAYAILRGEGDTRRTMYAMGAGSLINAILDPILIYWMGLGIAGAAWGTVISLMFVSGVQIYWLIIKKDTYVSLSRKAFFPSRKVMSDILQVGIPASIEFLLYSIDAIIINSMLVRVSGTDAVAVYTAGWRVIMMAVIPLIAIATAEVSVAGAAIGARKYENLAIIHRFSTKLGFAIGTVTALITAIFAPQITLFFTYSPQSAHLAGTMVAFMHVMCLFYPFMSPGIMSSSLFQGAGKGLTSLLLNILRDVILITGLAFLLGMVLGLGQEGIWWGIVFGNTAGSLLSYLWARLYITRLMKDKGIA